MARRIRASELLVPAGTLESAPAIFNLAFGTGILEEIQIIIPSGHVGLTGIALYLVNDRVIPETPNTWIKGNDEVVSFDLELYPDTGSWRARAFNTDVFDHTFYLRLMIDLAGGDFGAPAAARALVL